MNTPIHNPKAFELFVVPFKIGSSILWKNGINQYMSDLDESDPSVIQKEISLFDELRHKIITKIEKEDNCNPEIIVEYYRNLDSLSKRLPLSKKPIKINFEWYDSFEESSCAQQSSIAFEKANILYNLGASLCYKAYKTAVGSERSKLFQFSASVFVFISENFLHPPLLDISKQCLNILTSTMLGQAQESLTFSAISDGKSINTISKLSISVYELFNDAVIKLESLNSIDIKKVLQGSDPYYHKDAYSLIVAKSLVWKAISQYFLAEVDYNSDSTASSLIRFKNAKSAIADCEKSEFDKDSTIMKYQKDLVKIINTRIIELEKENSIMCTNHISYSKDLQKVEGVKLVKIIPIYELFKSFNSSFKDVFSKIIPLHIHEEISRYSEEKSKLLRFQSMKVNSTESEFQTLLTSFGFPNSLEKYVNILSDQLPKDVMDIFKDSKSICNSENSFKIFDNIESCNCMVKDIYSLLDDEIYEYQKGKIEFMIKWTLSTSSKFNEEFYNSLSKIQKRLSVNSQEFNCLMLLNNEDFSLCCNLDKEYKNIISSYYPKDIKKMSIDLKEIQNIIDCLESLEKTRRVKIDTLRADILSDDMEDLMSDFTSINKNYDSSSDHSIFYNRLSKFDNICDDIDVTIIEHNEKVTIFKKLWENLNQNHELKALENENTQIYHRFSMSIDRQKEKISKLQDFNSKFIELFSDIQSLLQKVKKFSIERKNERELLLRKLNSDAAQESHSYLMEKLMEKSKSPVLNSTSISPKGTTNRSPKLASSDLPFPNAPQTEEPFDFKKLLD